MSPAEIAAQLGLSVETIGTSRADIATFRRMGSIATNFISLYNLARRETDLLSRYTASEVYHLTQFWTSPGAYLGELEPSRTIPEQFTGRIPAPPGEPEKRGEYRYDVQIEIHYRDGSRSPFWVQVETPYPLSVEEANTDAYEMLIVRFKHRGSDNPSDEDDRDWWVPTFLSVIPYRLT